MKTTTELITPEKALAYLARNVRNRPLRESWVEYLAQQIRTGHWQTTHQGIAFSKTGDLMDGQHRLSAIVRANKAVHLSVTTGMAESIYKVTDCGLKRATFDRIHLVDDKGQNQLLCQVLNAYCRCALRIRHAIPVSAVEDEFLRYSDSWLWATAQFSQKVALYGRVGVIAAIAVYHVIDAKKSQEFMHGYRTGEDLSAGSPVLALRRVVDGASAPGRQHTGGADYWKAVTCTRAHYQGRSLRMVYEATEDMVGNANSIRLIAERAEKGKKAAATRSKRQEVA